MSGAHFSCVSTTCHLAESEAAATEALDRFARLYQDDPLPEF
jgi:hypothetical protein